MKKLRILIAVLCTALTVTFASFTLCGCELLGVKKYPSTSTYVSETGVNADSLMEARTKIRNFNISVDTQYYITNGWFSRTAGTGLGSGVVFDEDANYYYALTNNHVITNVVNGKPYSVKYTVTDIYSNEYSASLVITNSAKDIAIIKFAKRNGVTLALADCTARAETNLVPGEFVLAVGNPSGVNNIVTYGKVIGWEYIGNVTYAVINHNALINPGNSGGALCDIDGNLLGLNTWGAEDRDDNNFAIPLSEINAYISLFREQIFSSQQAA